jgi:hypothetical protein
MHSFVLIAHTHLTNRLLLNETLAIAPIACAKEQESAGCTATDALPIESTSDAQCSSSAGSPDIHSSKYVAGCASIFTPFVNEGEWV